MKTPCLLYAGVVLFLVAGCAQLPVASTATTSIKLSGADGTLFTGHYVKDGKSTPISGIVPWTFESTGISQIEILKANPADSLTIEIHCRDAEVTSKDGMVIGPRILGARANAKSGFALTAITR
jgi:hypothetical protein